MPEPTARLLGASQVRELADRLGIRPTKQWGQNFVVDGNTVERIVRVAGVGPNDVVVEVETAKSIVEKFKAKGIDPEGYTLYTYASFQIWSQAAAKAKTTDPKKVMEAIKGGEWDTVLGKLAFDAKGDIKAIDYVVYRWDAKGNYSEINKGS